MLIIKRNIMIAASYPTIITSGGNPRVNKELINNIFLRKYVSLFGELLKVKGNLNELKIVYIGGYSKEDNISRAKLYISAYNYYLNCLGYESLNKNNLTVIDIDNIDEASQSLEQCDLLFLGIGSDSKFASIIYALELKGIKINEFISNKNIVVSSICSGSVMSAERIYGGVYDNYYYGKELYEYSLNIKSLCLNPVTMETDFCPNDATLQKNEKFIENYLKPDSNKCAFFACKPNSFFLIDEDKIYSFGEIYLFIDGLCLPITEELEKADVTELVILINEYNKVKNNNNIRNETFLTSIKKAIHSLVKIKITTELELEEKSTINNFAQKEKIKNEQNKTQVNEWKQTLKAKLNYLFSDEILENFATNLKFQEIYRRLDKNIVDSYNVDSSKNYLEELYLKMNIISLIKESYLQYKGYFSDFKKDLFDLLCEYITFNDRLVYYALDTCGCMFTNKNIKQLLNAIKINNTKKPQQIINSTEKQLKLFRKEIKYERS